MQTSKHRSPMDARTPEQNIIPWSSESFGQVTQTVSHGWKRSWKTYLQPVKTHDFPGMKVNINSAMLMFTIVGISIDIRSGIGVPKLILKTASLASTGPKNQTLGKPDYPRAKMTVIMDKRRGSSASVMCFALGTKPLVYCEIILRWAIPSFQQVHHVFQDPMYWPLGIFLKP